MASLGSDNKEEPAARPVQQTFLAAWEAAELAGEGTPASASESPTEPNKETSSAVRTQPERSVVQGELQFEGDGPTEMELSRAPLVASPAQSNQENPLEVPDPPGRATLLEDSLPGILSASAFQQALHSDNLYTSVTLHSPPVYEQTMGRLVATYARLQNRIPQQGDLTDDAWRLRGGQSYDNERREFDKVIRLAEQLGPVALLAHVQDQYERISRSDLKYLPRMYGATGERTILSETRLPFSRADAPLSIRAIRDAQERRALPHLLATDEIKAPLHPKEHALKKIIQHSPHLENGGTLLVIVDNSATRLYLSERMAQWERVGTVSNSIRSKADRAIISTEAGSFKTEEGKINVAVLEPAQLKTLANSAPAAFAALTVVYHIGVNVKTGRPDLDPKKQVDIVTRQAIELTIPGQAIEDKSVSLNLRHPLP